MARRTLTLSFAVALLCWFVGPAVAKRSLVTGFAETRYQAADAAMRGQAMGDTVDARAEVVLLFVNWRTVTSGEPAVPTDPGAPAYNFSILDAAVQDAVGRGLDPLLTVTSAPDFAEGPDRPPGAVPGTWRPDSAALGQFAEALARRYSGDYVPAGSPGPLPRVRLYQAWTEPNLSTHLAPQYENQTLVAPSLYRALLNSFYEGVKRIHADNQVVTGGTAPYGDPPGGARTRPLRFWRDVLCLKDRRKLKPTNCDGEAKFDVLAHNAINTSGGPRKSALHPDDVSTPDLGNLRRVLRAAERHKTIGTSGRHSLWATELWWESNPPDTLEGVPLQRQARYLEEALYVLWQQGAEVVINLQLRDVPFTEDSAHGETSSGVLFEDGSPKPAFTAFRFPFVTERKKGGRVRAWGRSPATGELVIKARSGGAWRAIERRKVSTDQVFTVSLSNQGKAALRAEVGEETSLVWHQR